MAIRAKKKEFKFTPTRGSTPLDKLTFKILFSNVYFTLNFY